jgi:type II secretory pathway pseudopilin PulG
VGGTARSRTTAHPKHRGAAHGAQYQRAHRGSSHARSMSLPTPIPTNVARNLRRSRAFTLIELLVIIVIIGVLLVVAAPSFLGQQHKAHDSVIKQQLTVAYKAIKADSAGRNGHFAPNPHDALAVVVDSEPELSQRISATPTPDSGALGICSADSNSIVLVGHSKSGASYRGTASRRGWVVEPGDCDAEPNNEPPSDERNPAAFVQLVSTTGYSCALRAEGTIACWGTMLDGPAVAPSGRFARLSPDASGSHACALREDGTAKCWAIARGFEAFGLNSVPDPSERFLDIFPANNALYTCGLTLERQLRCWGDSTFWREMFDVPRPVGGFRTVSLSTRSACGLRMDGTALCWGDSPFGDTRPPSTSTRYSTISVGVAHTCALREDGTAECWGLNSDGRATPPTPSERYIAISAGIVHTCALREDGTAVCWGANASGEATVPHPDERYVSIRASFDYTCALRVDGYVRCWGSNVYGVLDVPN